MWEARREVAHEVSHAWRCGGLLACGCGKGIARLESEIGFEMLI
jgi:hypothetical protein